MTPFSAGEHARQGGPVKVWCLIRDQRDHVTPAEQVMSGEYTFVYDEDWKPERLVAQRPDLVLCVNDFHYEVMRCISAAREAGIPSLVLQDGILEWRCQYENPRFAEGLGAPQHQPVLADKIACLGPQSARQIGRWGNLAKVEVTGMPRMEPVKARAFRKPIRPGRRVLVMTAKKPGFTPQQIATTERSLRDTHEELLRRDGVEVVWRVTKGLHEALGVENRLERLEGQELAGVLDAVDAVITTPSTAMLEAMIAERPVAVLDYHNVPRFVQSAWTISAPEHIAPVIDELLDPPPRKMAFQRDCLDDVLWPGDAARRVARLISMMAASGREAMARRARLQLPPNMLGQSSADGGRAVLDLQSLYPGRTAFRVRDPVELQAKLARAEMEIARLRRDLERRRIGYWVQWAIRRLAGARRSKP